MISFCNFALMNLVNKNNPPKYDTFATIGFFDGVHLGHSFLLKELNTLAKNCNLQSLVVSFFVSPQQILNPSLKIKQLSTTEEKVALFEQLQLDNCLLLDFDKNLSQKTAFEFLSLLRNEFRVKKLLMGYDHRFGCDKISSFDKYKEIGKKIGVDVINCTSFLLKENNVSSSIIRNLVYNGRIEEANNLLGYTYSLTGEVKSGNKIGRKIGFPTANLTIDKSKLLPKNGVYIVDVIIKEKKFKGLLNIGTRPTINGENKTIEVHIIDFNEEIYKETITLNIKKYLREEQKFDSLDQLKAQIEIDKTNIE